MSYRKTSHGIEIPSSPGLDLLQTLDCDQCLHWQVLPNGEYCGTACGRTLTITEQNETVLFHGVTAAEFETTWISYFDLDLNYAAMRESLAQIHPTLWQTAEFVSGICLLQQDPWEALCPLILSQNNNIPRIKGLVDGPHQLLGEGHDSFYDFLSPERLAVQAVDPLAPIRSGFRAKYLIDAAQKMASGGVDLEALSRLPIDEARQSLMEIYDVGEKMVECALLYSLHRLETSPMDVQMKRAMAVLLLGYTPQQLRPYAGVTQQYLFHHSRYNAQLSSA